MERQNTKQIQYEFLSEDPNIKAIPIVLSLIIGAFFGVLNETLLNIALTTVMDEFHVTATTVQWLSTGFMLIMGIIIPISALLIQWFTTRQLFLFTMITFTIGTIVCAVAITFPILLLGRLLQAVGTGLLTPMILNVFLLLFPPKKRGTIMGIVGLVFMFAPAIGPTLSGVIVEYLGWRYLFILTVPFSLFSIIFGYKYLVNVSTVTKPKIDILSVFLSSIGFGGIVFGLSSAGKANGSFSDSVVFIPILVGTISLFLFSRRQFKLDEPILNLRVFQFPMFRIGVIIYVFMMMAMLSSEIILPMYMQGALAISAATAGLILLPGSLLNGIMSPIAGKLFDKFGPKPLLIPATLILSGTMLVLSKVNVNTSVLLILICYMLLMVCLSIIMVPVQTNSLNQLPKNLYAHGTAIMTTLQSIAGAIGISIAISLMSAKQNSILAQLPSSPNAIQDAVATSVGFVYFSIFILSIFTFILSLFVFRALPKDKEKQII